MTGRVAGPRPIELWEPEALVAPGVPGAVRFYTPVPSLVVASLLGLGHERTVETTAGRGLEVARYDLPGVGRVWARLEYHPTFGRPTADDLPVILATSHITLRERGPAGDWLGASFRRLQALLGLTPGGPNLTLTADRLRRLRATLITDATVRPAGSAVGRDADGLPRGESANHVLLHARLDEQVAEGVQLYDLQLGSTWLRDMAVRPPVYLDLGLAGVLETRAFALYAYLALRAAAGHRFTEMHHWPLDMLVQVAGYDRPMRPARRFEIAERLTGQLVDARVLQAAAIDRPGRGRAETARVRLQPGPRLLVAQLLAPFGVVSDGDQAACVHLAAFGLTPVPARRAWQDEREATQTVLVFFHYLLQRGPAGKPAWPSYWNSFLRTAITKRYRFEHAGFLAWRAKFEARATSGALSVESGSLWKYPAFARPDLAAPLDGILVGGEGHTISSTPAGAGVSSRAQDTGPRPFATAVARAVRNDDQAPATLASALLWPDGMLVQEGPALVRLAPKERLADLLAADTRVKDTAALDAIRRGIAVVLGIPVHAVVLEVAEAPLAAAPDALGRD